MIAEEVVQVNHRHVIFTIDEGLKYCLFVLSAIYAGAMLCQVLLPFCPVTTQPPKNTLFTFLAGWA